jgi:hypothetical protein
MIHETAEQKEIRMFNFYKKDLEKLAGKGGWVRMNCIEYACKAPKINPFKMAKALQNDGYTILFDDSSISIAENEKKRRKVEKIA